MKKLIIALFIFALLIAGCSTTSSNQPQTYPYKVGDWMVMNPQKAQFEGHSSIYQKPEAYQRISSSTGDTVNITGPSQARVTVKRGDYVTLHYSSSNFVVNWVEPMSQKDINAIDQLKSKVHLLDPNTETAIADTTSPKNTKNVVRISQLGIHKNGSDSLYVTAYGRYQKDMTDTTGYDYQLVTKDSTGKILHVFNLEIHNGFRQAIYDVVKPIL